MARQIIVVDDDKGSLNLTAVVLKQGGFHVLRATNAYEALDMIEEVTPDLFILDNMMPGMDGIELCRRIRARAQTAQTPVFMLSALSDEKAVQEALEAGADGYWPKTMALFELNDKIQDYFDRKPES